MITTRTARAPRGLRLYAIGDIHGDVAALRRLRAQIAHDLARRPAEDWRVILLGDYVDRGSESRAVLELLSGLGHAARTYCLRGNHDEALLGFLSDPEYPGFYPWLEDGGLATLASYGIAAASPVEFPDRAARAALRSALVAAMPAAHVGFLAGLPHGVRFGDYLFVHAGIRPGVPLERQTAHDLMWIREPFLAHRGCHGVVVVHGHSAVERVTLHEGRIAADTSRSGAPSCLVIEEDAQFVLTADGPCLLLPPGGSAAAA